MRRYGLLSLLALPAVALMAGAGWWWLGSDSGRQWVSAKVAQESAGSMQITGLSGHPLARLHAASMRVEAGDQVLFAESVALVWSPLHLLSGELVIHLLDIETLRVRPSPEPAKAVSSSHSMPAIALSLDSMHIGELSMENNGAEARQASDISLQGVILPRTLSAELHARLSEGALAARLSGKPEEWHVDGELSGRPMQARISATGQYLQAGKASLEAGTTEQGGILSADWQMSGETIQATGEVQFHAGKSRLHADWQIHSRLDIAGDDLHMQGVVSNPSLLTRPIPLDLVASRKHHDLTAALAEPDAGLKLNITYADGVAQGELRLAQWASPLMHAPGRLSGAIGGAWHRADRQWQIKGGIDKGEWAGITTELQIDGEGKHDSWLLRRGEMRALGMELQLAGRGDADTLALSGRLRGKDIGPALKLADVQHAAGSIQAAIAIKGSYARPDIEATAKARGIRLDNLSITTADLALHHAPDSGSYRFAASGLSLQGQREIDRLDINGQRISDQLKLTLLSSGRLQSRADLNATFFDGGRAEIVLSSLLADYAGCRMLAADRLEISLDGGNVQIPDTSLRLLGAPGRVAFSLKGDALAGSLRIVDLRISGNQPWISALPYRFKGSGDLLLSLNGSTQRPAAGMSISSPKLLLKHTAMGGNDLALEGLNVRLDYREQQLAWQIESQAPAQSSLHSEGKIALLFSLKPWQLELPAEQSGSGNLSAKLGRLSDIQPLLPRIDPLKGKADLHLNWSMPLHPDALRGSANISLTAFGVPEFGLEMQGTLQARVAQGKPVVDLRMQSGDGELRMQGPLDMDKRIVPDIHLSRFPLMQLPDHQLVVSGRLSAAETNKTSSIKGRLAMDRMRLEIPDPSPVATRDLQWPTETARTEPEKKPPLSQLDINLALGSNAEIFGRGMSLKPKGNLHIGGSMSQPELSGTLEIASGKIEFRSVKLDILADSTVSFTGDPKRPLLHIRAARTVGSIQAGVQIDGSEDQLVSQLFSTPAMSSAEVFSYIATGRPLASLGKQGASDMMTAAEFILGPGTMMQEVQGKIRQLTGLDVEAGGDSSGGWMKAGRKLSEDVTVSVEQTVSKQASTALTLQYMLSRNMSVFARQTANLAPQVGLRYSREFFKARDAEKQN